MALSRPADPAEIIERYVAGLRKKFPHRNAEIDAFLVPYTLPDGKLMNDDNIMHGLRRLLKPKGK
jgi:hypothetical protein